MEFTSSRRKKRRKILYISNKRRCITDNLHVNSSKSNNPNTYNSDNDIGNSNLPRINVHTKLSSNKLVTLQKEIDTESSTSTNEENMDNNNVSEELASHKNSTVVIFHKCDDNGINLINIEEESYVTYIQSININNEISMNDDENFIHKYYAPFLPSNNNEDVSSGSEYDESKQRVRCHKNIILYLLYLLHFT